jgi:hypothetical protein
MMGNKNSLCIWFGMRSGELERYDSHGFFLLTAYSTGSEFNEAFEMYRGSNPGEFKVCSILWYKAVLKKRRDSMLWANLTRTSHLHAWS